MKLLIHRGVLYYNVHVYSGDRILAACFFDPPPLVTWEWLVEIYLLVMSTKGAQCLQS